jgi:arylsulfatase A-like enzyme/Flp pilus assembly protein TadD
MILGRIFRETRLPAGIAIGLLLLVVVGGGFWWFGWPQPTTNLLFITLDTTRADRLGCYGYTAAATPTLDRLAAAGIRFDRAYSPAPLTLPAHASLFTGLYPPEHGLRTNGRGRLDESLPTLPELLRDAGYETAAFVSSFVLERRFGLGRGWTNYDDNLTRDSTASDSLQRTRSAVDVVDAALTWLGARRTRPFCMWVHFYDPHFPYDAHTADFGDQFRDRPYDGELASVDRQIARLLAALDQSGQRQNTWIIVAGDHGEGFGDHLERTHGYTLYDSTQRVPLLMEWPGHILPNQIAAAPVSLVDVVPTVVGQFGLRRVAGLKGSSLAPAFQSQPLSGRICYSMTDDPFLQNGWSPLRSVVQGQWKYIHTRSPELYDLDADPGETNNVYATRTQAAAELEKTFVEFERTLRERTAKPVQLTAREQRALEGLGYLGGRRVPDGSQIQDAPDVKEMLPFDVAAQDALDLLHAGDVEGAVTRFRTIVAESPTHLSARVFLGEALEQQGRADEAVTFYAAALKLKPDHIDALVHLGTARASQGHPDEAVAHFDEALRLNPESTSARYNLSLVLNQLGRLDEARQQLEETLRLDEIFLNAHAALANVLIQQGRMAPALTHLQQEVDLNPRAWEARLNLAVLLAEKDPAAAEKWLAQAERISPDNPQVLYNRGAFLLMRQQPEEAIPYLERAIAHSPTQNPRAIQELERARRLVSTKKPSE